ncbi:DUF3010 family protein [Marinobacter panjinensis]|uniref:DUF3010 family protein n=1 Tax=Marinobacter panjinensis TaxID=2576384 RepID=A0A4U6R6W2_9GAMM|nr:DUF3010 family protein [Marinobacter panjinensis]MCR8913387.1 DUF3010 family protein [Marinobacter panjinensis]TKV69644.1 DUF3010 family protein [Marinobacter panjinensis]
MIVCGVELTGSDAVVCLLKLDRGQFSLPECRVRKLSLNRNHTRDDLKQFQVAFAELMAEHGVTSVAIKERMPKGKFAGGAISFKLEAAIQLIDGAGLEVRLLSPALIKSTLAANPLPIPFAETGLKVFQETAFTAAYVGHMAK